MKVQCIKKILKWLKKGIFKALIVSNLSRRTNYSTVYRHCEYAFSSSIITYFLYVYQVLKAWKEGEKN